MAEVKVKYCFVKTSPQKIRQVIDLIRGWIVEKAIGQLKFLNKAAAVPVLELLKSGLAAAKDKDLNEENLFIKEIYCNEGPRLKRRYIRARGRATVIQKRMSHITLVLTDEERKNKETEKLKNKDNE